MKAVSKLMEPSNLRDGITSLNVAGERSLVTFETLMVYMGRSVVQENKRWDYFFP